MSPEADKSVLPTRMAAGPHGYGDPDDKTLRKVEIEVLIPKIVREKARVEKCTDEVALFNKCCSDSGLKMVWTCRNENSVMRSCLEKWYNDEGFRQYCTEEYLKERSQFRATGIKHKIKRA